MIRNVIKSTHYQRYCSRDCCESTIGNSERGTYDCPGSCHGIGGSGLDPVVDNCVAAVIESIKFPKPENSTGVQVNYPVAFRPTGV